MMNLVVAGCAAAALRKDELASTPPHSRRHAAVDAMVASASPHALSAPGHNLHKEASPLTILGRQLVVLAFGRRSASIVGGTHYVSYVVALG